jgi:hypothetical protein
LKRFGGTAPKPFKQSLQTSPPDQWNWRYAVDRRAQLEWVAAAQARQLGLIAAWQAAEAGIDDGVLRHAMQSGRLQRVRRGVYVSAGVPASYAQSALAAVLSAAASDRLVAVSHLSAAQLFGLPFPGGPHPALEITTTLDRCPRPPGVLLHRSGHFDGFDVTQLAHVPVTVATRIVVDLSMRLSRGDLGRLADEALRRRLTTLGALQHAAVRLRRAPGRSMDRVLALVLARTGEDASESLLESFAIDALKRFHVRLPTQQHPVRARGGRKRRVDLAYDAEKAAIEALGYEYHRLRTKFDADAVRGNELARAGFTPVYVTSAMTDWEVAATVAELIGDPIPPRPVREFTYADWRRRRYQ